MNSYQFNCFNPSGDYLESHWHNFTSNGEAIDYAKDICESGGAAFIIVLRKYTAADKESNATTPDGDVWIPIKFCWPEQVKEAMETFFEVI